MALVISTDLKPFDHEIVSFLFEKEKARFTELRDHLMKTLRWKNKGSLEVRLSRRLDSLKVSGYIKREKKSHKRVYYSLTEPTRNRLKLENKEFKELIKELDPSPSVDVDTLKNQTATSTLKLYLRVTPPILFEILADCFREGFPEEAELKQINSLVVELLAKIFVSLQEELKEKFEQGEDLQKTFEDVEKWVHQKYAEEE